MPGKYNVVMCDNINIDVGIITLQKQMNDDDCGLFTIAFAMAICNDRSTTRRTAQFDTMIMRRHLLCCLKDK